MYGCDGYNGGNNHTSYGSIVNVVVSPLIISASYAKKTYSGSKSKNQQHKQPCEQYVHKACQDVVLPLHCVHRMCDSCIYLQLGDVRQTFGGVF